MHRDAIMGVDASLTHTGVAVICVEDCSYTGKTCVPKSLATKRLIDIENWFNELLADIKCRLFLDIKCVVMEGYAYTPRFGQAFSLGELGGILKRQFYLQEIPLFTVQPQTLKKFITGFGKGDKNMMLLKAYKKWGIEFLDDHQCDSYALALIGKALYDIEMEKTTIKTYLQYEQEVIKLITKQKK
jgi:Holliday junction resolvasome RuvABC endonuclease subunit